MTFMVARHMQPRPLAQANSSLLRQQRAAQAVAQVDHRINFTSAQIGNDGFQGRQVPVDLRDQGQAHAVVLGSAEHRGVSLQTSAWA